MTKRASAIGIIGGADGPTSVFVAGKQQKLPLKLRIHRFVYRCRRRLAAKTVKPDAHTLEEVVAYMEEKYQATELSRDSRHYQEQYKGAREGLIVMNKPQLLGDLEEIKRPEAFDKESIEQLQCQMALRSERIAAISEETFPMDFHVYQLRIDGGNMEICVDFQWDVFGTSYSGNKKAMKKLKKISRKLRRYYGVTETDIQENSKRYSSLLTALST